MLYIFKIVLLSNQFDLDVGDLHKLASICVWVIRVYIHHWYECKHPAKAPANDLRLLKELDDYKAIDSIISQAGLERFRQHLWYLSRSLIPLALFDPDLDIVTKERIKAAMCREHGDFAREQMFRAQLTEFAKIQTLQLSDFASYESNYFFEATRTEALKIKLFENNVSDWNNNENYELLSNDANTLVVVNDPAERAISLIKCNRLRTKNPDVHCSISQIVWDYRSSGN